MLYRCPTCRTKYTISGKGAGELRYVKCQACGFLVETTSNRIGGAQPSPKTEDRPEKHGRNYLPLAAALIVIAVLAWLLATGIRWASSIH